MSENVAEVADRAGRRVRRKVQIPRVISHIVWTFDRPLTFIGEGIVNETPLQCESCNWLSPHSPSSLKFEILNYFVDESALSSRRLLSDMDRATGGAGGAIAPPLFLPKDI